VIQFGIHSAVGAFLGAEALNYLAHLQQPLHVEFWIIETNTTFLGVTMGLVLILLAAMEYSNALVRVNKAPRILWLGGVFSGFFGGLRRQTSLYWNACRIGLHCRCRAHIHLRRFLPIIPST
jgi:hypothetical protein